ncbi:MULTISPECIES: HPF/RaiA family ribosome-associated protein [unclassified Legionella]|uniref:HPF/RaiA family ribosome-associated protein n=1 Tax=unclassified Legionella TaxID=2622702 RepID=UPI0010551396|nr:MULTISPECIES: HPF/RaiA family ribosome-associated protein [unclassified Legionella]MDI9818700.1 HPF/RaiA family ribosome-associated protein [Legionella sp. PL877]
MKIQFNTNNHINGHLQLEKEVESQLLKALGRFDAYITRLEIHLGDENSHKSGQKDKRCLLEARLKNYQPIAVSDHAPSIQQAITGAIDKLTRMLDDTIQRLNKN